MSLAGLVQYDSSDDSNEESDNENISESVGEIKISVEKEVIGTITTSTVNQGRKLILPDPIQLPERLETDKIIDTSTDNSSENLFNTLPKPKNPQIEDEIDEDDDIPMPKIAKFIVEKPPKKEKGPVKISIPSVSDFDDIEDSTNRKTKLQTSKGMCGVLSLLPPPKSETINTSKLIPHNISKTTNKNSPLIPTQIKGKPKKIHAIVDNNINPKSIKQSEALNSLNYDSNTDDEDEDVNTSKEKNAIDFFSLSKPVHQPLSDEIFAANKLPLLEKKMASESAEKSTEIIDNDNKGQTQTLTSTVMNLPKEEIILKNKAEIGPKLPVPEQEFNIDAGGNVAFDDKAIEYLCGKRGVKRKNQIVNENEVIDINGEDIKPDEREWLVKALTEEPVRRPVSLSSGPSGQSKKKHQITYLAHQAKAMEVELQNQWASSNLARRQTRSKYGF